MEFINPFWFWGLSSLSIPLWIHLWNKNKGKVVKVGSLHFLKDLTRKESRKLRPYNLFLLILRCLALSLLVFLLSGPSCSPKKSRTKGYILLPKDHAISLYRIFKYKIDSLKRMGYETHWLDSSFTLFNTDTLAERNKTIGPEENYFHTAVLMEEKLEPLPAYFFTDNFKSHFRGEIPVLAYPYTWQRMNLNPVSRQWIEGAWIGLDKKVYALLGKQDSSGTHFQRYSLPLSGDSLFSVRNQFGKGFLIAKKEPYKKDKVSIEILPRRIGIVQEGNEMDRPYVKALVSSLGPIFPFPITLESFSLHSLPKGSFYALFWLSKNPVPRVLLNSSHILFSYGEGLEKSVHSSILPNSLYKNQNETESNTLLKIIVPEHRAILKNILWEDGFGDPILCLDTFRNHYHYTFYTRLDPAYSDLVWQSFFPRWFLEILVLQPQLDTRMDAGNLLGWIPPKISISRKSTTKAFDKTKTVPYFTQVLVLMVFFLFFLERMLSNKPQD